jgi:ABC-type uncharacterized transport system permease subunit
VTAATVSPDGRWLYVGGEKSVFILEVGKTYKGIAYTIPLPNGGLDFVQDMLLTPDGRKLYVILGTSPKI